MSKAASLVQFEHLPPGVFPIKDYPSLGATLVECDHAETKTITVLTTDGLPASVEAGETVSFTWRYVERQLCVVCKSLDEDRPVKMLARLPKGGSLTLF